MLKKDDKKQVNRGRSSNSPCMIVFCSAKFKDGKVYAWNGGKTSWSIEDKTDMLSWKYSKLAENEE